jgi:hypothetical protein
MLVLSHHPNLKLVSEDVSTLSAGVILAPSHFYVIIGWRYLTMEPAEVMAASIVSSKTALAIP